MLSHAGETFKVELKRVASAQRFTLRVRNATRDVVLTMPARGSVHTARDFAERHAAWIGARLKRLPQPVPFAPGSIIPLRGINHVIVHRPDMRGTVWVEPYMGRDACAMLALCVAGEAPHVARRVSDYLKKQAKLDIEAAVTQHTKTIGRPARSITLRDTTSRWGSCTAAGALNFSWRIILAPAYVLDYLAAHEVAHLIHMNHGKRFWALTHKLAPQTERAEAWLKAHGASLHRYGG